jgi:hypothetical protein
MNESATLRFEFVESGGSGPGPAGPPAPGSGNGGDGSIPPANVPGMTPPPASNPSRAPSGDSSVINTIKDLLNQSGAKGMLGPLAPAADKAVEVAGKLEKIFDGMNRATRPSNEPIVPPAMPKDPSGGGPIDPPIPGLPMAGGGMVSVVSAAAGAVVSSAAFLGMVAKASNSIAASQSKYSPDVAIATANADVRDIRRELELGRRFGPDVAAGIDAASRAKDNVIRGTADEIASWNRLYRAGAEFGETATRLYRDRPDAMRAVSRAVNPLDPEKLSDGLNVIDFALRKIEDGLRSIGVLKAKIEQDGIGGPFGKPLEHLPLPAWVTDGGGIPVEVKYNGPVMEAN